MPRDNFQALFSNKTQHSNDEKPSITPLETVHTSVESTEQELSRSSLTSVVINGGINNSQRSYASASDNTKPGTESIAYLKRFVSPAIQNIRDLKLAEKMNALADNLDEYPERVRRDLEARRSRHESCTSEDEILFETWEGDRQLTKQQSDEDMAEDCERLRKQAEDACQQVAWSYDELMKFVEANPKGTYEEFIQSLLSNTNEDNKLLIEDDFYKKDSRYRNLWNDNLTLGLASDCTTLDGRLFVAARDINPTQPSDEHEHTSWARPSSGDMANPKRLASSAYNVLSNVSSLAMKPLRDLQLAEKVNAMQLDIEEEEARKEIERYHMREGEKRDLEEMMKLKKEAEERTLTLTMDHLMSFHEEHPGATYTEWIEDLVRSSIYGIQFEILEWCLKDLFLYQ